MNIAEEKLLGEIKNSFGNYTIRELMMWRQHVIDNPYKGGWNISDKIISLISEEIVYRTLHPDIVSEWGEP